MKQQDRNVTIVIFGATDHEEKAARELCRQYGLTTGTATYQGKPVHAGNAYLADGHRIDTYNVNPNHQTIDYAKQAIIFECNPNSAGSMLVMSVCDHHMPGHYGYSLPVEKFWEASSIGQLAAIIGIARPAAHSELLMVAADDHCPADAYRGDCPGIRPTEFFRFRVWQKTVEAVGLQHYDFEDEVEKIKRDILIAAEILDESIDVKDIDGLGGVIDLRMNGFIPQLPEAALRSGAAYIASIDEVDSAGDPTGNRKIVLGGHTTPKQVKAFISWAQSLGNRVGEPYGNPTRGYAGVVVRG